MEDRWTSTSAPYLTPNAGNAWADEAAATSRHGTQRITWAGIAPATSEVVQALVLNEPAQVIVRRRVMLLDGQPVELVDSHYPVTVADGTPLAEMTKISGGAVSLLASLGYHADDVREEITARLPTDSEQDALNIGEHEPVLVLTRVILTSDGRPFEFTVMRMIAQGRHLRYRMAA